ncbi:MAG: hypothetical protein K0Q79_369 [Flavipsychrobacter sp.]|jgi:hypothetical protein|nr:hypothetical protein [Flavipsychrobacter sp.]
MDFACFAYPLRLCVKIFTPCWSYLLTNNHQGTEAEIKELFGLTFPTNHHCLLFQILYQSSGCSAAVPRSAGAGIRNTR